MPHVEEIPITKVAVSHVVGKGGETIKQLKADTNTKIDIVDDSIVRVTGEEADCKKCRKLIEAILEEQANPDYEGPEGKRLRGEADALGQKRDAVKNEAQAKFDAGDKEAGHKLMAEAAQLTTAMHDKNKEAAKAILKNRNADKGDAYLDLHGLRTEEALEFTKERIADLERKPAGTVTQLELIPGAGHHSAPGKIALKPACANLLTDLKLSFTNHSAGSFMVTVPGKGPAVADNKKEVPTPAPAAVNNGSDNKKTAAPTAKPAAAAPAPAPSPAGNGAKAAEEKKANEGCCIIM